MKILVVDDDRELCSMLSEFLRQRGFDVECERTESAGSAEQRRNLWIC